MKTYWENKNIISTKPAGITPAERRKMMNIYVNNPEELLFTLEICQNYLPPYADPAHFKRLQGLMEQLKREGGQHG